MKFQLTICALALCLAAPTLQAIETTTPDPAADAKTTQPMKLPNEVPGPHNDEDFVHLFGDVDVPSTRTEAFLQDSEYTPPGEPLPGEDATTDTRIAYTEAATTESLRRNAEWRAENAGKPAEPVEFTGAKVKLGNEVLFDDPALLKKLDGKRIGLITNPSGMDSRFVSTIDKLAATPGVKLTALFAPEHGVRGAERAGEKVLTRKDEKTGVPVYSLHGSDEKKRRQSKPRPSMLDDVDILMYDIQDIGNRSYTYAGTMKLAMQAAVENGKEFWVLDRPNPMGGNLVSGNVLDTDYMTLVGWAPLAYLYGLTPGETALWLNKETDIGCELTVVPMKGWKRSMKWWDTGLPWIPTSTHMQVAEACWYIAMTGTFGELHALNEGVGYPLPFGYFGAPWVDPDCLAQELNSRKLPGVVFRPAYFRPYYHIYKEQMCGGVQIHITDYDEAAPVEASIHIMDALNRLYPEQRILEGGAVEPAKKRAGRIGMFNRVMGGNTIRRQLIEGVPADEIIAGFAKERDAFAKQREKYFLYRD